MSGREARRGWGTRGSTRATRRNWARATAASSRTTIIFEPIVERLAEAGIQIEIPTTGEPALVGVTPLLVDRSGVYLAATASRARPTRWQPVRLQPGRYQLGRPRRGGRRVETGLQLAKRLQGLEFILVRWASTPCNTATTREIGGCVRCKTSMPDTRWADWRSVFAECCRPRWCGSWLHFRETHLAGRAIDFWFNSLPAIVAAWEVRADFPLRHDESGLQPAARRAGGSSGVDDRHPEQGGIDRVRFLRIADFVAGVHR